MHEDFLLPIGHRGLEGAFGIYSNLPENSTFKGRKNTLKIIP